MSILIKDIPLGEWIIIGIGIYSIIMLFIIEVKNK